jgi:hypothetical protein
VGLSASCWYRCELDACIQILAFQIWKLSEYIIEAVARSKVFENELDRVAQSANDRLAVTNFWISSDP